MNGWVLDASIALAWALPDERSDRAERFFENVVHGEVRVPAIFWYEVTNGLAVSARRGRLSEAAGERALHLLSRLPIATDAQVGQGSLVPINSVAREHELSAYDGSYLELAARSGAGLATLDEKLEGAARTCGVKVYE